MGRRGAIIGLGVAALGMGVVAAPAHADQTPFVNGTAKATALLTRLAPGTGALQLAITGGVAVSELRNDLAQAQAQTIDFGLIGGTLTARGCRGGDPTIKPSQLPQPLFVDNRKGNAASSADELAIPGLPISGGHKEVAATKVPSATSSLTGMSASLDPLVKVGGGKATAVTEIIPGKARIAHATSEATLNIAGVVQLSGMRWDALHRTGETPAAVGTFDLGRAQTNGLSLPTAQAKTAEDLINQALVPSGITISFPTIQHITSPVDLVRVTPLIVDLKDTPIGKTILGPVLNGTRDQRSQAFDQLSAAVCDLAGALFVGDVGVGIAAGTGFLAIEIGGVEAMSAAVSYADPFGPDDPPLAVGLPPVDVPGSATGTGPRSIALPGTSTVTDTPFAATIDADVGTPQEALPIVATGATERRCESVHPFRWPSCSPGAPLSLGVLGFCAAVGVAALDWRRQRRGRPAVEAGDRS